MGRKKQAAFLALLSIGVSAVTGLLFCAVGGNDGKPFLDKWLFLSEAVFFLFGGGSFVAALLLILTNMSDDLVFGFGHGLYYGTYLGGGAIHELLRKRVPEIDCLAIAFVITALVCYIVWLKKFKDKQKE